MSEPVRFLTSFAQSVATMALYGPSHPARKRAVDASYRILRDLQTHEAQPEFSFLGDEVVYGHHPLREMRDWEWAARLAASFDARLFLTHAIPALALAEGDYYQHGWREDLVSAGK